MRFGNIEKLYLFKFFKSLYFFTGVLIPFFTEWGRITFFQVMLLQMWFVLWSTILEIPTGAIADHFGRKASVAIGILVNIIGVIFYVIKPDLGLFFVAEFFWALSAALISGADIALVYDSLKEDGKEKDSKKVLGRYTSLELLGITLAAPLGSIIASAFGLRYPTMLTAIPFLISLVFVMGIKEPEYKKEQETYFGGMIKGINYLRGHKVLGVLVFDAMSFSVITFFIIWLYQPLLSSLGVPIAYFGIVHAAGSLLEAVVMNRFVELEGFLGSKKGYMFFSAASVGIAFILLSFSGVILSVAMIVFIFALGMTRKALFISYINKHIESHNRATVNSAVSMLDSFGRTVFYPLVGLLVGVSLRMTLFAAGAVIIFLALFSKVEEGMLLD